jgi:hypothetical protein
VLDNRGEPADLNYLRNRSFEPEPARENMEVNAAANPGIVLL